MIDLGIYNFIRSELAQGQTKESIASVLSKRGMSESEIADAFMSVQSGAIPPAPIHSPAPSTTSIPSSEDHNAAISAWNDFRSIFWKYFLVDFIIGTAAAAMNIGAISIVAHATNLILQLLIAITIGRAAKAFSGKSHYLLVILGFFFPPAGYYYVYQLAKKDSDAISLNILEWIFVVIGLIGYFLVVIAVIGIVAALVLANLSH